MAQTRERMMSFVFYLIAALTVAGGLAAVLLKNTVHCALALTVAFAGLALLFLELDAQFAGVRADSGLHRRGRHPGGLCDSADARLGDAEGRCLQPHWLCRAW
jgi:hypothetical protein